MEESEIYKLLTDKSKKISNWDSIITYFSQRMMNNDLNGLYSLTTAAINRIEEEQIFDDVDLVPMYFFLAEILEREGVEWRNKKTLNHIEETLLPKVISENQGSKEEIANAYYELGKHYDFIHLAEKTKNAYLSSAAFFFEIGNIQDSAFVYSLAMDQIHYLPKEKQVFPSITSIEEKYASKGDIIIHSIKNEPKEKRNPVEQSEEYLKIIDLVEEEIVRLLGVKGVDVAMSTYYALKHKLLHEKGVEWEPIK